MTHTPDLWAIFRAGRVRRWHPHADLADTDDRVDGHASRVARLILALHPEPENHAELIVVALTHDDGEAAVGDVRGPAKDDDPDLADRVRNLEFHHRRKIWVGAWPLWACLDDDDRRWLDFADRLDRQFWARQHAHLLSPAEATAFAEAAEALLREAADLGCEGPVYAALCVHEEGKPLTR